MSQLSTESKFYLYRRIAPPLFKVNKNWVDSEAFRIKPGMKGLSVYRADVATPYEVLEARLAEARVQLQSEDEAKQQRAQKFLTNNPDVRTLVEQSQYRVVKVPIAAIKAMGTLTIWKSPIQQAT